MQKIQIIGHIGRDAQVKGSNGREFITFSVAANQKFKKDDGTQVEITTWYNCLINDAKSKLLPFLKQGTQIFVEGRPSFSVYKSEKDGKSYVDAKINVTDTQLLGKKDNSQPNQPEGEPLPDDDLPF